MEVMRSESDVSDRKHTSTSDRFLCIWVTILTAIPDYVLSNVQIFLMDVLGFSSTTAASIVNAQDGFTGIFGIVGAVLADSYLSHHGIIFISSLFYVAGLVVITGGCYHIKQYSGDIVLVRWLVGFGLFLIAIGKFCLRNSANALLGKGMRATNGTRVMEYAIKFLVLILTFAQVYSFTTEESSPSSPRQFLVSAILVFLVTVVSFLYLKANSIKKESGDRTNPLKYVLRVYVSAIIKRQVDLPENSDELYETPADQEHKLAHTIQKHRILGSLDKAAIIEPTEPEEQQRKKWLSTVTEVEGSKLMLYMVPICMTFLAYGMIKSVGDTFFLDQGNMMDATVGSKSKNVPVQTFIILGELVGSASKRVYKVLISNNLAVSGKKYSPAIEYAMGMVLSSLCCSVASWLAMEVWWSASKISVFWLIPQFMIFGAMDGLASEGIEEFFIHQLPPALSSYESVFTDGLTGAGTFLAIILVMVTKSATNWFADDTYRLDRFYHLCTVVGITLFFFYIFCAVRYHYLDDEEEEEEEEEEEDRSQVKERNEHAPQHEIDMPEDRRRDVDDFVKESEQKTDSILVIKLEDNTKDKEHVTRRHPH